MSDPQELEDVIVTGQRRADGSTTPFPSQPIPDPTPPGQHDEKEPGLEGEDPCRDPVKRAEWAKDAAAARAAEAFVAAALANGESARLDVREYGAWLIRMPDGSIGHGPITAGIDTFAENDGVTSVHLTFDGIDPSTIVGSVHSHNPGNHLPSDAPPGLNSDHAHLQGIVDLMNGYAPGSGSQARLYIVARTLGPANATTYNKLNVYTPGTMDEAKENPPQVGPEVNPNAQPCSGF